MIATIIMAMGTITMKGIVQLVVVLAICGVVLRFTQDYIHPVIFKIICAIIIGAFCLFTLQFFDLL